MTASTLPPFARRLKAERAARGWSGRELGRRAGTSPSTVIRAEKGHEVWLSAALAIAAALDLPLSELTGPFGCARCLDRPLPGFTCRTCGADGPEVTRDGQ